MATLGRVWLAATALCLGTAAGSATDASVVSVGAIVSGAVALAIRRKPMMSLSGLLALSVGAGMLNAQLRLTPTGPLTDLARQVPRCEMQGTILESIGSLGLLVHLSSARCDEVTAQQLGVGVVREGKGPSGALFEAQGWIVPLGDDGFDLSLRRAGAEAALHVVEMDLVSPPSGIHGVAERVRAGLAETVSPLEPRAAALIEGLTIGDTSGLDPVTLDHFRSAGLSHVLAVSGSNVAIVLGAVLVAARTAGHRVRIGLGYCALGLFALIVGPDPSVLRAVAMGSIALACLAHGRSAEPLAALGLAIIGVVALRPGMLFSVGMQLSTAATAGIVIFSGRIGSKLHLLPSGFGTMVAATLAAQVAVAPILLLVFGEISIVSPLANALALPAVAPSTIVGLGAATIALFAPGLAQLVGRTLGPLGAWILAIGDRMGSLSWSLVELPRTTGWVLMVGVVWWGAVALRQELNGPR